jgi:hypothetical protein
VIFVTAATVFPTLESDDDLDGDKDEDNDDPCSFYVNAGSSPIGEPAADSRPPLSVARAERCARCGSGSATVMLR